jgi:magnesium-transporting ATPase (P-type)
MKRILLFLVKILDAKIKKGLFLFIKFLNKKCTVRLIIASLTCLIMLMLSIQEWKDEFNIYNLKRNKTKVNLKTYKNQKMTEEKIKKRKCQKTQ